MPFRECPFPSLPHCLLLIYLRRIHEISWNWTLLTTRRPSNPAPAALQPGQLGSSIDACPEMARKRKFRRTRNCAMGFQVFQGQPQIQNGLSPRRNLTPHHRSSSPAPPGRPKCPSSSPHRGERRRCRPSQRRRCPPCEQSSSLSSPSWHRPRLPRRQHRPGPGGTPWQPPVPCFPEIIDFLRRAARPSADRPASAIVAGTAPLSRMVFSTASAVSTFCGYGMPCEMIVDSSATTGRPCSRAVATSGFTSRYALYFIVVTIPFFFLRFILCAAGRPVLPPAWSDSD